MKNPPASQLPADWVRAALREGLVIPAHPLALNAERRWDERRQRALTRYYHAAGAGGIAVGVHTTQFEIRAPGHGLYEPVLELAARTALESDRASGRRTVLIAGICGATSQARREAAYARAAGYHAGLLSLASLPGASDEVLLEHCRAVAAEIPLFGFYLTPAVGGRVLARAFWRRFSEIERVVAIKVAPFDRYRTLDVVRAVAEAGRAGDIALYTGNDDAIVPDLYSTYEIGTARGPVRLAIVGGLLGHWAVWTKRAVELLQRCKEARGASSVPASLITLGGQVTDANAALFDAAHGFAGCIPGVHEVLRRQGLLESIHCLDPALTLSPGQSEELDRVVRELPHLTDDDFVRENLARWLG